MIGNFGDIVFETSDKRIFTLSDFKQSINARWNTYNIIGSKPLSSYAGKGLRTITFTILLSVNHGIKPREMLEKLEKKTEEGVVERLIICGKPIGIGYWKITKLSESWNVIYSAGELASATADLTLEEY